MPAKTIEELLAEFKSRYPQAWPLTDFVPGRPHTELPVFLYDFIREVYASGCERVAEIIAAPQDGYATDDYWKVVERTVNKCRKSAFEEAERARK